jgi:hypothetical protein
MQKTRKRKFQPNGCARERTKPLLSVIYNPFSAPSATPVRQAKPGISTELKREQHEKNSVHHEANLALKGVIPKAKPGKANL